MRQKIETLFDVFIFQKEMLELPTNAAEVGVDEAGRGCLWGPVVAGAVLLPNDLSDPNWEKVKDSKKVSPKARERLAKFIEENALGWGVGFATAEEIDRYNILHASHIAMHRALDALYIKSPAFESIAVDGIHFDPWVTPDTRFTDDPNSIVAHCVAQGDNTYLHIAAASILAKVHRDTWVKNYMDEHKEDSLLPHYALNSNMGYGTAKHMAALREHGPHALHRKTFRPCCPC